MSPDAFVFLSFLLFMYVRGRKRPACSTLHSYTHFFFVIPVIHHTILSILYFFPRVSYSPNVCMHLWGGFDLPVFSLWWYLRNCLVYVCFSPRSHYIEIALQGWFLEQAQCFRWYPFLSSPTIQSFIACFLLCLASCYIYICVLYMYSCMYVLLELINLISLLHWDSC